MKWLHRIFLSVFAVSAVNLVASHTSIHRDIHFSENSGRQASRGLEKNYNEPTQAYLWRSTHLGNADRVALKNYNPIVEYSSRGSAYLGVPKLGIIPEFRMQPIAERHDNLDIFNLIDLDNEDLSDNFYVKNEDLFAEPRQKLSDQQQERQNYLDEKHENLNLVARNISLAGQSLGLKSRGWLLPHEDVIKQEVAQIINTIFRATPPSLWGVSFDQVGIEYGNGPFREDLQIYKNYYGPAFGPTFLKLAESVPEAFKSIDGFQNAMNYFFQVFQFRLKYLAQTGEHLYEKNNTWENYLSDGFNRFIEIFVKKFNHQGIVDSNEAIDMEIEDYDLSSLRL